MPTEIQLAAAEMYKQLTRSLGGRVLEEHDTADGLHVFVADIPNEKMAEYVEKSTMINGVIALQREQRQNEQTSIDAEIAYLDPEV